MRSVRAVSRRLLALDLLRARDRRAVRAALHGDLGAAGRPVSVARPGARVRRRGRERDRSDSQRPGRRGLRGRGDRQHAVADLQRRRLRDHGRGDRARDLPLARGPGAGASEGGRGGAALMAAVTFCVVAPETERLDRFLADQLALSRTVAARIIADKRVTRDGRPLRASVQLERGAVVTVELPPEQPPPKTYAPAHRDLAFAYEDEHLAVLDKPAGLVVHPGPGHWDDTLVNVLVERGTALAQGAAEGRPGIVHRLDRDTSGLLLVAKTDLAHRRLTRMIERRQVTRVYAALAWGHFAKSPVDIEAPITRHPTDRKRMTVLAGGRHAITHVRVTARFAQTELLRVTLGTGRTHQIRVHLAHVGHPVVGDREYAFGGSRRVTPSQRQAAERVEALAPRQLLHAARLAFAHPVSGARLDLRCEKRPPIRVCLLNATPCSILASSLRMSDPGVVRLLLFRVGRLVCAAEADRVREIVPWFEPTWIPGAPPVVAGVVNVRGTLVTVVEGWRALRQPEPAADGGGRGSGTTVLLEVGGGKKVLGFTVDEVVDLVSVGGETLDRRQALPGIDPTLVRTVGRRAGQLFVVLDTDALLTPILSS